ncbi:MAG: hypothetical protein OYH77_05005 [Pseudomonadota bacterium]|nr:hypothetical protein [Pseudomonadota bacterium]
MAIKKLLKVRHVYVSHTHIDHFVGFDRLLRAYVPHHREIEICGAPGIVANIRGKLAGYTWNLLVKGQINFLLHEVGADFIRSFRLHFVDQATGFRLDRVAELPAASAVTTFADGSQVYAALVDHGIPVATYRLSFPQRYRVRREALDKHDLKAGEWIKRLQAQVAANASADNIINVGDKEFKLGWLRDQLLIPQPEFAVSYLTDLQFNWHNLKQVQKLHHRTTVMFCESAFAAEDRQRAQNKSHLTTKQCALLAAFANAQQLENFHFSSIYGLDKRRLRGEASDYFKRFKQLAPPELQTEIHTEMSRCYDKGK